MDESVDVLVLKIQVKGAAIKKTSSSWSASDAHSKAIVLMDKQCLKRQRVTWKVTLKSPLFWAPKWGARQSKPVLHGQVIESPDAQPKRSVRLPVKKNGSICGWLRWSDKSVGINQFNSIVVNPNVLGEFGRQVRREHEVSILDGDLHKSLFGN